MGTPLSFLYHKTKVMFRKTLAYLFVNYLCISFEVQKDSKVFIVRMLTEAWLNTKQNFRNYFAM
jgi:hypothetical protein